jgi:hypothetical protein
MADGEFPQPFYERVLLLEAHLREDDRTGRHDPARERRKADAIRSMIAKHREADGKYQDALDRHARNAALDTSNTRRQVDQAFAVREAWQQAVELLIDAYREPAGQKEG